MEIMLERWINFQGKLKSYIYSKVRDKALAEDLTHDVFIKVQSKLEQLHEKEKLNHWAIRIAQNAITDHYRRQAKAIAITELDWNDQRDPLQDCVTECLQEMITTLPPKYREALELAELQNFSQTELATKLNISYSGVKSRVQRARQLLKKKMDEQYNIQVDKYGHVLVCEDRVPCNCNQGNAI